MELVKKHWKLFSTVCVVLGAIGYFMFGYIPKERGPKEVSSPEIIIEGQTKQSDLSEDHQPDKPNNPNKEMADARKVAEDFSSAFFQFNGDIPNENLENAAAFVTGSMAEEMKDEGQVARPLDDMYKLKLTHVTSTIEEDIDMYSEVTLTGDFYSLDGKKTETVAEVYHLKLEQGDDEVWRVSQFSIERNRE